MKLRRPKSNFCDWLAEKQREDYQKDVTRIASWIAWLHFRNVPEKRKAELFDYMLRRIEDRKKDYYRYHEDGRHIPKHWDARNWTHLYRVHREIMRYKEKKDE